MTDSDKINLLVKRIEELEKDLENFKQWRKDLVQSLEFNFDRLFGK